MDTDIKSLDYGSARLSGEPHAPIMLFGHRGYSALAPENTLAAFQKAVDRGIPGAELDVQLSGDGEPVVIHDSTLKRTAGLDASVRDTPLPEIRALDAGGWFAAEFRGEKVPLLEEVFAAFGGRLYFDVELKWDSKTANGLEEKVVQAIRRHGLERRCLLSSFNPYCLLRARRLAPGLPMALIWNNSRELPFLLRLLGRRLVVWTVDDPQEARRLIGLGVRGLISNDPGRMREVLGEA